MKRINPVKTLYRFPIKATRSGPLFNAHPYPTKISPESLALLIACQTKPGALVFDGFGGSGTTGMAALLCSNPPMALVERAKKQGLSPEWGPRNAVVYELGGLGAFIGQVICMSTDPTRFTNAAERVLAEAERRYGWLYTADELRGTHSRARYYIWTDCLECPKCHAETTVWKACVQLSPAKIADTFRCSECRWSDFMGRIPRLTESVHDELLDFDITIRRRVLARINGDTHGRHWSRAPNSRDLDLIARINSEAIPTSVPIIPMMGKGGTEWGDLWRSGYHRGITHVHHFYTRRNLIATGGIWSLIENESPDVRPALSLWASSYNASHSTLMTRIVAKKGHNDFVLTSSQSGVLYISGLPVEKNIFLGLKRKIRVIASAFSLLSNAQGHVEVVQGSGATTKLADESVDYVFMDPPFGGNIPYSEVNFINEAWLRRPTRTSDEAVVSAAQEKGIDEYEALLTRVFKEAHRVLKPTGIANIAFNSTKARIWAALVNAYTTAGFTAEHSTILDKTQGSFKQVTTQNFVRGDPLILLVPNARISKKQDAEPDEVIRRLVEDARNQESSDEMLPQRLYSRFVSFYVRRDQVPPINASNFYRKLSVLLGAPPEESVR